MYFVNMLPVLYRPALFYLGELCHIIGVVFLLFHSCSVCSVYRVILGGSGSLGGQFRGPS